MIGLRTLVKKSLYRGPGRFWVNRAEELPWFDRPNALDLLERRRKESPLSNLQYELLNKWVCDGYVILDGLVPTEHIDTMLQDLEEVWMAEIPTEGLVIEEVRLRPEDPPGLSHRRLVELDQASRQRIKRECLWRIHGFYQYSKATRAIFDNRGLTEICSLILGLPTLPQYTINFAFGSRQHLHQDTAVFFVHPANYLIAAWLACEAIDPASGPVVYYPGSHREPLYRAFDNYPQTNLKTCAPETTRAYERYLEQVAAKYPREAFIAQKGQVLLWHGMLIHGGDTVRDPGQTRRSYVCHYMPPGMNKENEIEGPFNW